MTTRTGHSGQSDGICWIYSHWAKNTNVKSRLLSTLPTTYWQVLPNSGKHPLHTPSLHRVGELYILNSIMANTPLCMFRNISVQVH